MKKSDDKFKWHEVDESAAKTLTTLTNSAGVVFSLDNTLLPEPIKKMTGVSSYYATGYTNPQIHSSQGLVIGEMVVARNDDDLTKNYNYVFAVSSSGKVYFAGPYKGFGHHLISGTPIDVSSLFGQTPYSL